MNKIHQGLIIEAKYLPVTDKRPSRVKATCKRDATTTFTATVSWDHGIDNGTGQHDGNYRAAAEQVIEKMDAFFPHFKFRIHSHGTNQPDLHIYILEAVKDEPEEPPAEYWDALDYQEAEELAEGGGQ